MSVDIRCGTYASFGLFITFPHLLSISVCFVFGVAGALLGSGIVLWLGSSGIPAFHDVLYFLFAGPSLQPVLYVSHVVMAFGVVFVVALLSTLYPAWLATRITPVSAMRGV